MNFLIETRAAGQNAEFRASRERERASPTCAFRHPGRVGIFHRSENLQGAIDELLGSGFHHVELSLLASESTVQEKLSYRYEKVNVLADDFRVPRSAYVSTEAIGGAEDGLIGGLVYVGTVVAAGAVVASSARFWPNGLGITMRITCASRSAMAAIVMGADVEYRRRGTRSRHS